MTSDHPERPIDGNRPEPAVGPPDEVHRSGAEGTRSSGWSSRAGWALLVARWVAAQIAIHRLAPVRRILAVVTALSIPLYGVALLVDPDWPWVTLGSLVLLTAGTATALLTAFMWALNRLALPRRARQLRFALDSAHTRVMAEVGSSGIPLSVGGAVRFVLALVRRQAPHREIAQRLLAITGHLDEVLETSEIRAALEQAQPSD